MSENTFFQVSRAITRHPILQDISPVYFKILIIILDYMAWEKITLFDHGNEVILEVGQLMASDRKIASWAGCRHDEVQRALAVLTKVQILRQEVRHRKRIITLSDSYICKKKKKAVAPTIAPGLRQDCAINNKNNKQITIKQEQQQPYTPSSKVSVLSVAVSAFFDCLEGQRLEDEQKQSLMRFSEDRVRLALEWSVENPPKKTLIAQLMWHCQQEVPPPAKGKNTKINLKLCSNYFKTRLQTIPGVKFHPTHDKKHFVVGSSADEKTEIYLYENPHVFKQQLLGALRKYELPVHEEDIFSN